MRFLAEMRRMADQMLKPKGTLFPSNGLRKTFNPMWGKLSEKKRERVMRNARELLIWLSVDRNCPIEEEMYGCSVCRDVIVDLQMSAYWCKDCAYHRKGLCRVEAIENQRRYWKMHDEIVRTRRIDKEFIYW